MTPFTQEQLEAAEKENTRVGVIPIEQTKFGREGDCFAACIASITGIPLSEIFSANTYETEGWWEKTQESCNRRGFMLIEVPAKTALPSLPPGIPMIVVGKSPRMDGQHAIVGITEGAHGWRASVKYLHDPHPDKKWIDGEPTWYCFVVPTMALLTRQSAQREELDKLAIELLADVVLLANSEFYRGPQESQFKTLVSRYRARLDSIKGKEGA